MKETNKTIQNNAWLHSGNALWRPASAPCRGPPSPLEALQNPVVALKARLVWELLVRRLKTNSLPVHRHLPSPLSGPETGDITLKVLVVLMMVMVVVNLLTWHPLAGCHHNKATTTFQDVLRGPFRRPATV